MDDGRTSNSAFLLQHGKRAFCTLPAPEALDKDDVNESEAVIQSHQESSPVTLNDNRMSIEGGKPRSGQISTNDGLHLNDDSQLIRGPFDFDLHSHVALHQSYSVYIVIYTHRCPISAVDSLNLSCTVMFVFEEITCKPTSKDGLDLNRCQHLEPEIPV